MRKVTTGCCALCQIDRVGNKTPIDSLKAALELLTKQKEENTEVGVTTGDGQTATFTIVCPGEDELEANLIELGYTMVWEFERRKGYPTTGNNKLYIKNL